MTSIGSLAGERATKVASERISLTASAPSRPGVVSAPALGLAWLVRLRWVAAGCQLAVLAAAMAWFSPPEAPGAVAALIGLTVGTNSGLAIWLQRGHRSSPWLLAAVLLLDVGVLTWLMLLSGGPSNPFTVFYLVHVALAALLLNTKGALLLSLVTSACFASLFVFTEVDPHAHHGSDFSSHLQGMWISYTLAAGFVGYFVAKVARSLQRREQELAALEQVAARAEKLASLSTLSAGAAHELGTPLGTIAIVAKELERASEGSLDPEVIRDDARLLRAEAERCRRILDRMASDAGQSPGERPLPVAAAEILLGLRAELGDEASSLVAWSEPSPDARVLAPPRTLVQALANLVRNGVDASHGAIDDGAPVVRVEVGKGSRGIQFVVTDRGEGIPPADLARLGEPFFSTKAPGKGLGLGLFLVRALADRCGGALEVESRPGRGSTFQLTMPAAP